jgi:DNA-binding NarL/FixJ family response regulator
MWPAPRKEHFMQPIRILLVEDHALVRAGIRELLNKIEHVTVVGESSTGREALDALQSRPVDIVLMDIAMPDMSGLEALTRIRQLGPSIRVIMLSMYANEEYVLQALRSGAQGYLLKDSGKVELELAIQAVAQGQTYLCPVVASHVSAYMRRVDVPVDAPPQRDPLLTPRQTEILHLIAEGRTTQEIAQALTISAKTVETHRAQLMQRLGIYDIAGLVRYAVRTGIIS